MEVGLPGEPEVEYGSQFQRIVPFAERRLPVVQENPYVCPFRQGADPANRVEPGVVEIGLVRIASQLVADRSDKQ